MNTLLVTSEVTFVPGNYIGFFESLFRRAARHLGGLLLLTNSKTVNNGTALLRAAGCCRFADVLAANVASLRFGQREAYFKAASLPVVHSRSINEAWIIDWVRERAFDVIINARTRCIYRPEILRAPQFGCLNVHHGILPTYRGTMCDLYALAEHRPAGFSVHQMTPEVDAGPILHVEEFTTYKENSYVGHLARSACREGEVVAGLLNEIATSGSLPTSQPNQCSQPVFSHTPDFNQLVRFREELQL